MYKNCLNERKPFPNSYRPLLMLLRNWSFVCLFSAICISQMDIFNATVIYILVPLYYTRPCDPFQYIYTPVHFMQITWQKLLPWSKILWKVFKQINRTLPSPFDIIHPIDMNIAICNELPLYFQLRVTTWCLIRIQGKHSYINDVTSSTILDFLTYSNLNWILKMVRKQHLAVELSKIVTIYCKVVSI